MSPAFYATRRFSDLQLLSWYTDRKIAKLLLILADRISISANRITRIVFSVKTLRYTLTTTTESS